MTTIQTDNSVFQSGKKLVLHALEYFEILLLTISFEQRKCDTCVVNPALVMAFLTEAIRSCNKLLRSVQHFLL